jgi:hypothetical protein
MLLRKDGSISVECLAAAQGSRVDGPEQPPPPGLGGPQAGGVRGRRAGGRLGLRFAGRFAGRIVGRVVGRIVGCIVG